MVSRQPCDEMGNSKISGSVCLSAKQVGDCQLGDGDKIISPHLASAASSTTRPRQCLDRFRSCISTFANPQTHYLLVFNKAMRRHVCRLTNSPRWGIYSGTPAISGTFPTEISELAFVLLWSAELKRSKKACCLVVPPVLLRDGACNYQLEFLHTHKTRSRRCA